ncbi:hypothetical protein DOY81_009046 [Sarcophaga bullata]|nr:hypothetical protein DOY81_009046 [Sarcophaga bullata]
MSKSNDVIGPVWRESASLIICAKSPGKIGEYDYKVLLFKRSDHTAFFKNQGYFEEFGVTQQSLKELLVLDNGVTKDRKYYSLRVMVVMIDFFKKSKIWAREISLRINAIRETFEETGIFLSRNREQLKTSSKEAFCLTGYERRKMAEGCT